MNCTGWIGSSVHGILQARILEWLAISYAKDLPDPGIKSESPAVPALKADSFFFFFAFDFCVFFNINLFVLIGG